VTEARGVLNRAQERMELLTNELSKDFKGTHLVESVGLHCRINIPKTESLKLSQIFRTIEKIKDEFGLADYAVSEATLDSIFVRLNDPNFETQLEIDANADAEFMNQ